MIHTVTEHVHIHNKSLENMTSTSGGANNMHVHGGGGNGKDPKANKTTRCLIQYAMIHTVTEHVHIHSKSLENMTSTSGGANNMHVHGGGRQWKRSQSQ